MALLLLRAKCVSALLLVCLFGNQVYATNDPPTADSTREAAEGVACADSDSGGECSNVACGRSCRWVASSFQGDSNEFDARILRILDLFNFEVQAIIAIAAVLAFGTAVVGLILPWRLTRLIVPHAIEKARTEIEKRMEAMERNHVQQVVKEFDREIRESRGHIERVWGLSHRILFNFQREVQEERGSLELVAQFEGTIVNLLSLEESAVNHSLSVLYEDVLAEGFLHIGKIDLRLLRTLIEDLRESNHFSTMSSELLSRKVLERILVRERAL